MNPLSVLIVDDDSSFRSLLALALRRAGYAVSTAASGAEAMDQLKSQRVDCLITDAKMAPVNGFDLALFAKELQPDLRVLMISAVYDDKDIRKGHPIDHFFTKPVPEERIIEWLSGPNGAKKGSE